MSLLLAAAFAAGPFLLVKPSKGPDARFENAQVAARDYLERNPRLEVDAVGELILGAEWLDEMRAAASEAEASADVRLPPRLMARSQARLDGLLEDAYQARMDASPAWRLGVLDAQSPPENYFKHAFVHEMMPGVVLCVVVLLLVGAPLERTWGSLTFGAFALAAIPATAHAYRLLDASSGVPWSGSAGLAGALLGAYFIRGLGGHFMFPGFLLLPAWLGVETLVVRGFWIDDPTSVPWATLCAAVGLGAGVSGALRLLNVEAHVDDLGQKSRRSGPHPIVSRAARLRSDGDPYQAFDLIQAAWRDEPRDEEVCEAFFSIAVEVGQPEAAAEAIVPSLRAAVRQGDFARAVDYWFPLAQKGCEVDLEPTAFVRLGEALLDAGHAEEALFSLRGALAVGVSSAHATRIVNIARDLDESLTREAAAIALADPTLDPQIRTELATIAASPEPTAPTASPEPPPATRSQLDRRVHAEHQTVETTAFPLDLDADLDTPLDGERPPSDANEAALAEQALDTGALSAESLAAPADVSPAPEDSGDVLSHWNDPSALGEDSLSDLSGALDEAISEDSLLQGDDLGAPDLGFDFGLREGLGEYGDPRDDETDSDLTPMMEPDSTDEVTNPMASEEEDTSTAVFDQPTTVVGMPAPGATPPAQSGATTKTVAPSTPPAATQTMAPMVASPVADDEFAFGGGGGTVGEADPSQSLRALKAIEATPVELCDDALEIDAVGRGKSKLPFDRIEALSIAAVDGLGPRPVLVLDFVLNWRTAGEAMKSIRFRSDRFDPLVFAPGAETPLAALTRWVATLESRSGATCLPSRDILDGCFSRHESLADYEREVLLAAADG